MNKTININLGGTFFHIDENAYNHLRSYLEAVRATLSPEDSIAEIMDDIEARIAELFNESISNKDQVITITRVKEVIEIMGQPEAFDPDNEDPQPNAHTAQSQHKAPRQLFRDEENKYLGGVASGLGALSRPRLPLDQINLAYAVFYLQRNFLYDIPLVLDFGSSGQNDCRQVKNEGRANQYLEYREKS